MIRMIFRPITRQTIASSVSRTRHGKLSFYMFESVPSSRLITILRLFCIHVTEKQRMSSSCGYFSLSIIDTHFVFVIEQSVTVTLTSFFYQ